jgi:spermidine/putrescine transport system permease protein
LCFDDVEHHHYSHASNEGAALVKHFSMQRGAISRPFWWVGLTLIYVPIATLIIYSFVARNGDEIAFSFDAYRSLASDKDILESVKNSLFIAVCSATISVLIGGLAAFGMRRAQGGIERFIGALTLAPLVLPEVVFGLGLLMWFVILRISLGSVSLILAHVTFSVSYVYMTVSERAGLLDHNLDDAAEDLGATRWQTFFRVHLPLLTPACIAGWMMAFTLSFDDFLISFFTAGPDVTTLPLTLYGMVKFGVTPVVFAISSVIFATSFVSSHIVRTLTR